VKIFLTFVGKLISEQVQIRGHIAATKLNNNYIVLIIPTHNVEFSLFD